MPARRQRKASNQQSSPDICQRRRKPGGVLIQITLAVLYQGGCDAYQ